MLSCEYCKIFKKTYFEEPLQTAASDYRYQGEAWQMICIMQEVFDEVICSFILNNSNSLTTLAFIFLSTLEEKDSGNYKVWIHSETRRWHDENIESKVLLKPRIFY